MTYFAALSGGSWPVMSFATHNFPDIDRMVESWRLTENPVDAPKTTHHLATPETLLEQIYHKLKAGFNVSFAEFLGRALSYEFVVSLIIASG